MWYIPIFRKCEKEINDHSSKKIVWLFSDLKPFRVIGYNIESETSNFSSFGHHSWIWSNLLRYVFYWEQWPFIHTQEKRYVANYYLYFNLQLDKYKSGECASHNNNGLLRLPRNQISIKWYFDGFASLSIQQILLRDWLNLFHSLSLEKLSNWYIYYLCIMLFNGRWLVWRSMFDHQRANLSNCCRGSYHYLSIPTTLTGILFTGAEKRLARR